MRFFSVFLMLSIFSITIFSLWFYQSEAAVSQKARLWLINQKLLAKIRQDQQLALTEKSKLEVLGDKDIRLPISYQLSISPRKQVFNLSCEFAAAVAILYHYKNDEFFSLNNELQAEKALITKIPASVNPNIGIRMGDNATTSADMLYQNLNQRFGGTEYYGVHAPPFIDMFAQYGLLARPIQKENLEKIKKAIFSGHLVMTWISVGYGKAIDIALSYGTTPVVRGEHAVVIYGYNEDGVFIMDPGIGKNRFLSYQTLAAATTSFPLPFLEVFPSINGLAYDPTEKVDVLTGLDRSVIKILIQNSNKKVGAGNTIAEILRDFGYKVLSIEQVASKDHEGVSILIKKELSDYEKLLRQDISLAGYKISSFSATLASDSPQDAVVVLGEFD